MQPTPGWCGDALNCPSNDKRQGRDWAIQLLSETTGNGRAVQATKSQQILEALSVIWTALNSLYFAWSFAVLHGIIPPTDLSLPNFPYFVTNCSWPSDSSFRNSRHQYCFMKCQTFKMLWHDSFLSVINFVKITKNSFFVMVYFCKSLGYYCQSYMTVLHA